MSKIKIKSEPVKPIKNKDYNNIRTIIHYKDIEKWNDCLINGEFSSFQPTAKIPINRITEFFRPFEFPPWSYVKRNNFTVKGVYHCLHNNVLERRHYRPEMFRWNGRHHEMRVAYLVVHHDESPISIEILDETASLDDGWHRLSAAIIRGDRFINVVFGGHIDDSVGLFGVINPDLQILQDKQTFHQEIFENGYDYLAMSFDIARSSIQSNRNIEIQKESIKRIKKIINGDIHMFKNFNAIKEKNEYISIIISPLNKILDICKNNLLKKELEKLIKYTSEQ